jgi:hypothetical protein
MARLRADIWASALIRRATISGAFATVVRRGHAEGGVILIKLNTLDGKACVLSPVTGREGERRWLRTTGPEPVLDADAEAYLARAYSRDPDCWVIEIEDRQGRWFFDEPLD